MERAWKERNDCGITINIISIVNAEFSPRVPGAIFRRPLWPHHRPLYPCHSCRGPWRPQGQTRAYRPLHRLQRRRRRRNKIAPRRWRNYGRILYRSFHQSFKLFFGLQLCPLNSGARGSMDLERQRSHSNQRPLDNVLFARHEEKESSRPANRHLGNCRR